MANLGIYNFRHQSRRSRFRRLLLILCKFACRIKLFPVCFRAYNQGMGIKTERNYFTASGKIIQARNFLISALYRDFIFSRQAYFKLVDNNFVHRGIIHVGIFYNFISAAAKNTNINFKDNTKEANIASFNFIKNICLSRCLENFQKI